MLGTFLSSIMLCRDRMCNSLRLWANDLGQLTWIPLDFKFPKMSNTHTIAGCNGTWRIKLKVSLHYNQSTHTLIRKKRRTKESMAKGRTIKTGDNQAGKSTLTFCPLSDRCLKQLEWQQCLVRGRVIS